MNYLWAGVARKLLLFIFLRGAEYVSAAVFLYVSAYIFSANQTIGLENITSAAFSAIRIPLIYFAGFHYWSFSFLVFLIAIPFWPKGWRSLSAINTLPFVLHSSIFVWSLGRNPFAPELWVTWFLVILSNAVVPFLLHRAGWIRFLD